MKSAQSPVCWGLSLGLLLAWSTCAAADVASCKTALFRAHQLYLNKSTKAKAKEARGRLTGRPLAPGVTADRILRARQQAASLIATGCGDLATQQAADPRICTSATSLDECLADFVTKADAHAENVRRKVLRLCQSRPTCGKDGLPQCTTDDECYCHLTVEDRVNCITPFDCQTAQPCNISSQCPPDHECYVNTCCPSSVGVCGPTVCDPAGGGSGGGLMSNGPR